MAKIDKETGFLITFYLSLLCTLTFPIYVIYDWEGFIKKDELIYPILVYVFFGPFLLGISCNYYRKKGWSELLDGSLGCLILIIAFAIISFIFSLF